MTPLRICVDARVSGDTIGGVAHFIVGLVSGLANLRDGDEEYFVLTMSEGGDWITPHVRGPCRVLSARTTFPASLTRALKALPGVQTAWNWLGGFGGAGSVSIPASDGTIEEAEVDLMHFTAHGFWTKVPTIFNPHDLQSLHYPEFFSRRVRLIREVVGRALCEKAAMVAVASSWCRRDLIHWWHLPEDKVRVVALAPATAAYQPPREGALAAVRRKLSLPARFAFYPAQTWRHKNHIGLLRALARVRDQHGIVVPLVCSGHQNDFFPQIAKIISGLGLNNQVQFLGFVDMDELQCLYALARCVVIPTKFEAASFPLWEAFLAGTAAACSNVTSLPEQAGDAAIVFDPDSVEAIADAVRRLWTDDQLVYVLAQRGRERVSRLSWDQTARAYRAHYRRLAGRHLSDEDKALLNSPPLL